MTIPHADRAVVDIHKLRDYSLNPLHAGGKHKARIFAAALGMTATDTETLRDMLLEAVKPMTRKSGTAMLMGNARWLTFSLNGAAGGR